MRINSVTQNNKIKNMAQCAVFSALLCICSPIAIPIGPIPVTLSLFAVMLAGIVLDVKKSFVSVLVYILLGLCGLPVFAGAKAGFSVIIGPTGGYLWSYLIMVVIVSVLGHIEYINKFAMAFIACILGTAVCYLFGTVQYCFVMSTGFKSAFSVCVYPFIVFDLIKAVCASLLGVKLRDILKNISVL